jgi:hypothetical protein
LLLGHARPPGSGMAGPGASFAGHPRFRLRSSLRSSRISAAGSIAIARALQIAVSRLSRLFFNSSSPRRSVSLLLYCCVFSGVRKCQNLEPAMTNSALPARRRWRLKRLSSLSFATYFPRSSTRVTIPLPLSFSRSPVLRRETTLSPIYWNTFTATNMTSTAWSGGAAGNSKSARPVPPHQQIRQPPERIRSLASCRKRIFRARWLN